MEHYYELTINGDDDMLYNGKNLGEIKFYFKKYSKPFIVKFLEKIQTKITPFPYNSETDIARCRFMQILIQDFKAEILQSNNKVNRYEYGGNWTISWKRIVIPTKFEDFK